MIYKTKHIVLEDIDNRRYLSLTDKFVSVLGEVLQHVRINKALTLRLLLLLIAHSFIGALIY